MSKMMKVSIPREWVERWAADEPWAIESPGATKPISIYHQAENIIIESCRTALEHEHGALRHAASRHRRGSSVDVGAVRKP